MGLLTLALAAFRPVASSALAIVADWIDDQDYGTVEAAALRAGIRTPHHTMADNAKGAGAGYGDGDGDGAGAGSGDGYGDGYGN